MISHDFTDYLFPEKGLPRYRKFIGIDIETTPRVNRFYLGSIYGDGVQEIHRDPEKMLSRLFDISDKTSIICATNLSFDLLGSISSTKYKTSLRPIIRGSRMIFATIRQPWKRGRRIRFCDTMSFFPMSVADLGSEIVGVDKMDRPSYLGQRLPNTPEEEDYMERYCLRDSEISQKTMTFIGEMSDRMGGEVKSTAASSSFDLWRRKYLKYPVRQMKSDDVRVVYDAYYGGRTEVFRRGRVTNRHRCYDINSLYPFVMAKQEFPLPSSACRIKRPIMSHIRDYMGVSRVRVKAPDGLAVPFLPFRHESGKLLFPLGTWEGVYTHAELNVALDLGYEISLLGETVIFLSTWKPFERYVADLYRLRLDAKKSGRGAEERLYKLYMNSLYGRFAMDVEHERKIIHVDDIEEHDVTDMMGEGFACTPTGEIGEWLYFDRVVELERFPPHVMPILSAYVTAYGRIELYNLVADDESCIYCDTDSIFTENQLPVGDRLGELKLEYEIEEGTYIRPKLYAITTVDGKVMIKAKGSRISTMEELREIVSGKKVSRTRFASFLQCNRKNKNRFLGWNEAYELERSVESEDTKRHWGKVPFSLDEEQCSSPLVLNDGKIPDGRLRRRRESRISVEI